MKVSIGLYPINGEQPYRDSHRALACIETRQTDVFLCKQVPYGNHDKAVSSDNRLLWPSCVADADIIFLTCGFFYLLSLYLFS